MNVLFISRIYPNPYNDDGRVIHSQALEIKKQGHEIKVISPTPFSPKLLAGRKKLWKEYSLLEQKEIRDGIEIYRPRYIKPPSTLFKNLTSWIMEKSFTNTIFQLINKELKDYTFDLVHCHMTYPDGIVIKKLKDQFNVSVIVSARSSDLDGSIQDPGKRKRMNEVYKQANHIITPSQQLNDKLITNFGYRGVHIGNGIYPYELESISVKEKEIDVTNKFVMLSVSNLIERKGIETNIRAIANLINQIPNLHYIIIGDGPEKERLKKLVNNLGVTKHVEFLGKLDHHESMKYMKICHLFCLPSKKETFGLVYLEALFYNKPIILCEGEAIALSLKHEENAILAPPDSPKTLSMYIDKLYNNPEYLHSLSRGGKEFVLENYTWEKIGERLVSLYF